MIDNTTKVNLSQTKKGDVVFAVIGSSKTNTLEIVHGEIVNYAIRSIENSEYVFVDAIIKTLDGQMIQSSRIYMIDKEKVATFCESGMEADTIKENGEEINELTITDVYPNHDTLLQMLDTEWMKYHYHTRKHMTHNERIAWQIDYKRRKRAANQRAMIRVTEYVDLIATLNAEHPFETA